MEGFKDFLRHVEKGYGDEEVVNLYLKQPRQKISEIAALTNKSVAEIYRILHDNYVAPNRLRLHHHNVISLLGYGLPVSQIAELTGYTPRNIRYIASKLKMENYATTW